jgi:hypothetical protein
MPRYPSPTRVTREPSRLVSLRGDETAAPARLRRVRDVSLAGTSTRTTSKRRLLKIYAPHAIMQLEREDRI